MLNFLQTTPVKKEFERFDEDTKKQIENDIITEFDNRFGSGTIDMISFEVMILVWVK